jgi:hypothetical protein
MVVRMRMRVEDSIAARRRVASSPSTLGIRMSISATSGAKRRTAATACSPSAASPRTSMSGSWLSNERKPARTIA